MAKTISDLTPQQLRRVAGLKEKIERLEAELNGVLSGKSATSATGGAAKPKRKMSAEGRARIVAAQKRRWAKKKKSVKKKK